MRVDAGLVGVVAFFALCICCLSCVVALIVAASLVPVFSVAAAVSLGVLFVAGCWEMLTA